MLISRLVFHGKLQENAICLKPGHLWHKHPCLWYTAYSTLMVSQGNSLPYVIYDKQSSIATRPSPQLLPNWNIGIYVFHTFPHFCAYVSACILTNFWTHWSVSAECKRWATVLKTNSYKFKKTKAVEWRGLLGIPLCTEHGNSGIRSSCAVTYLKICMYTSHQWEQFTWSLSLLRHCS